MPYSKNTTQPLDTARIVKQNLFLDNEMKHCISKIQGYPLTASTSLCMPNVNCNPLNSERFEVVCSGNQNKVDLVVIDKVSPLTYKNGPPLYV